MWPHPSTPPDRRRGRHTFRAGYPDTIAALEYEVLVLHGKDIVIGAGFRPEDLRQDGLPRVGARQPAHPGIELSFTTEQHGRLTYATDVCELWQHNLRSIALGLEALRAVDRYGITPSGQQYAGFRQLTTATGPTVSEIVTRHGGWQGALRATHPDTRDPAHGYTDADFAAVNQAWQDQHTLPRG